MLKLRRFCLYEQTSVAVTTVNKKIRCSSCCRQPNLLIRTNSTSFDKSCSEKKGVALSSNLFVVAMPNKPLSTVFNILLLLTPIACVSEHFVQTTPSHNFAAYRFCSPDLKVLIFSQWLPSIDSHFCRALNLVGILNNPHSRLPFETQCSTEHHFLSAAKCHDSPVALELKAL